MREDLLDCLVIGGGPAGLTAALYLARYHLSALVLDHGESRASWIPITHNYPGFPDGVSGKELLNRLRQQARKYGAVIRQDEVVGLARQNGCFDAECSSSTLLRSRTVLLATGVENVRPALSEEVHAQGLARGLLRYCPVCDGFEITDKRVAVLGTGERAFSEAMFLRSYTSSVTLISAQRDHEISADQQERLNLCSIALVPGPCLTIHLLGREIELTVPTGTATFDSLYPALGTKIRSSLARELGVNMSADGCILVDKQQRSSLPGLYAAGDVVYGLDQICGATGQAAMAATSIRNDLCHERQLLRASDAEI